MSERHNPRENKEIRLRKHSQPALLRSFIRQLDLERRYAEKLFNGQFLAIKAEIGNLEQQMSAKFEEIETSLSLIAREIVRRNRDLPSDDESL